MWVAKLIGTDIEVASADIEEAYCAVTEFDHGTHRVSMKFVPRRDKEWQN